MSKETQQKEEMAVFRLFSEVCGYSIDKNSVVSQDPPKPDIRCQLKTGETIEFELANAIDSVVARKINSSQAGERGGFTEIDPIEQVIEKKISKLKHGKYHLSGDRFELLVYLGKMFLYPYQKKTIPEYLKKIKQEQQFHKIWVFSDDVNNPQIIFQS